MKKANTNDELNFVDEEKLDAQILEFLRRSVALQPYSAICASVNQPVGIVAGRLLVLAMRFRVWEEAYQMFRHAEPRDWMREVSA